MIDDRAARVLCARRPSGKRSKTSRHPQWSWMLVDGLDTYSSKGFSCNFAYFSSLFHRIVVLYYVFLSFAFQLLSLVQFRNSAKYSSLVWLHTL